MNPIVISGLGGSGTRVVAEVLNRSGVNIGFDLNESKDDLTFTLLFKRPCTLTSRDGSFRGDRLPKLIRAYAYLRGKQQREAGRLAGYRSVSWAMLDHVFREPFYGYKWPLRRLLRAYRFRITGPQHEGLWGWKEPHAFLFLPWLLDWFPEMTYVHVVRHGFDMAYTDNLQQFKYWRHLFGMAKYDLEPRNLFEFWYRSNWRTLNIVEQRSGGVSVIIRFEEFCRRPEREISKLLDTMGIEPQMLEEDLAEIPSVPNSTGRHNGEDSTWIGGEEHRKLEEVLARTN